MEITTSERALLGLFMAKIHRIDPDVLVVCCYNTVLIYNVNSSVRVNELDQLRVVTYMTCYSGVHLISLNVMDGITYC